MSYFTSDALDFLTDLQGHNDREWFKANERRFEAAVRTPALRFIQDAAEWLEAAGHPFRGEAKKAGGAMSRIHRDTRFSKDKTPYHTHIVLHFHHKDASKSKPGPVIGVRFDGTGDVGMGGGLYGGDTPTLNKVRDAIARDPDGWTAATKGLDLWGDSLKTAPKGYDKDHPLIDDIRRKGWMTSASMNKKDFTGDLLGTFQRGIGQVQPLTDFLAKALL